jgi:hypothetical protein
MSRALGCSVAAEVRPTINPLVYTLRFRFGETQPGKRMLLLWNIVQMYAWKNDAVPQGRLELEGSILTVRMGMKRRLGQPKDLAP